MPEPEDPNAAQPGSRAYSAEAGRPPPGRRTVRRLLAVGLTTGAVAYLVVCVVVFSLQAKLIYFPDSKYWTTPDEIGLAYEDLTLTTEDGVSIAAWYVPRDEPQGTVLFSHGNAGNIADRIETVKSFHHLSYNVLIFDYRGYGHSSGKPSEKGTYCDAEAAWCYLVETRGEPPGRIVLFGRSLGGAVAIELATRHTPGALVLEATFTSLVDVGKVHYPFLPIRWLCTYRYASIEKVAGLRCPKLFLHGTDDELVPIENGRRLFKAAAEPKEFIQTPGGHNDSGFERSPEYTHRLRDWLDRTLREGR